MRTLWFGRDAVGRRSLLIHRPSPADGRLLFASAAPQTLPLPPPPEARPSREGGASNGHQDEGAAEGGDGGGGGGGGSSYWEEVVPGIYSAAVTEDVTEDVTEGDF